MDRVKDLFTSIDRLAPDYSTETLVLALTLSFVLGQLMAWTYIRTHTGVSYSRSFTQSVVLMMMVVSLVMFVIQNNIITAFGLIGALALIRFRNVLKDTRDTVFVFFSLVLGMAIGSQRYMAAVTGTIALCLVAFYFHFTRFGTRGHFDGHLTCRVSNVLDYKGSFAGLLRRFCRRVQRVSIRHREGIVEYVFQVCLRDRNRGGELSDELLRLEGVENAVLILHDELTEV